MECGERLADKLRARRLLGLSMILRCPCGGIDSFIGLFAGAYARSSGSSENAPVGGPSHCHLNSLNEAARTSCSALDNSQTSRGEAAACQHSWQAKILALFSASLECSRVRQHPT